MHHGREREHPYAATPAGRGGWQASERSEPVRTKADFGAPEMVAGEVDVLLAERREVSEQPMARP